MKVEFTQEVESNISRQEIIRIVSLALRVCRISRKVDLGVVVVGNRKMLQLNQQYRGKKKTTAVLSFPYFYHQGKFQNQLVVPRPATNFLGEIFLAPSAILRRAKKYSSTYRQEFTRLLIHGVLHLLGYTHQTKDGEKKMINLEKRIICYYYSHVHRQLKNIN